MNSPQITHNKRNNNIQFESLREYIIFENEDLIVLNKPEGLLSIPDGYDKQIPNLRDILHRKFGQIWVVHRLDKDTSGVIIFAKNAMIHKKMNDAFNNRNVRKKYYALIHGVPFWNEKVISYPLLLDGDRRHRTTINMEKGKPAETNVLITHKDEYYSGASIWPKTGFTHQIRSHLSQIGHPIIGDTLYDKHREKDSEGNIKCLDAEKGLFLHASELEFLSEFFKLPLFVADLPVKFLAFGN